MSTPHRHRTILTTLEHLIDVVLNLWRGFSMSRERQSALEALLVEKHVVTREELDGAVQRVRTEEMVRRELDTDPVEKRLFDLAGIVRAELHREETMKREGEEA